MPNNPVRARFFCKARPLKHRTQRGFTLLETLIALTILSFSLAVIFQTFSTGIGGISRAERHGYAVLHAKSVMASVGTTVPLSEGQESKRYADGYEVEILISSEEDPNSFSSNDVLDLYMVKVVVSWGAPYKGSYQLQGLKAAARR